MLSNATYANNVDQIVEVIREQFKEGSDFVKIYQTGHDSIHDGVFSTPYQYTVDQLKAAVNEATRVGNKVAVHAMGEPGTLYAAEAGVVSIDHAAQLGPETMRVMREKQILAVPTFTIFEYFADHPENPLGSDAGESDFRISHGRIQEADGGRDFLCCGIGCRAVPHGTQARELVLMAKFGMPLLEVLKSDLLNGAKLLGWGGQIGELKAGYFADVIAVPGNPLEDIGVTQHVSFVMKGGVIYRR